jgi:hypothetical protein
MFPFIFYFSALAGLLALGGIHPYADFQDAA